MAEKTKEDRNLNITLKNEERQEEELIVSFPHILRKMKKFFLPWLLVSIIVGGAVSGISIFFSTTSSTPVKALVSFSYSGIEKGKNPDGTDFDEYALINPQVIDDALIACNMDRALLETVRQDIVIDCKLPTDAIDRITAYKSIFDSGNQQIAAAEKLLAETWYPTQFEITFRYKEAGLSRTDAVRLINEILDQYRLFFYGKYGYNNPLGNALTSVDYTEYDYSAAVDIFSTNLNSLKRYVNNLANDDKTHFRSSKTGYTFSDLREAINAVQSIDLSLIDSYLRVNNIAKNKERLQAYYEYRIEAENRSLTTYEENLATIKDLIDKYEKDQIIIFTDGTINTESKVASEEYDRLINRQITAQNNVSESKQLIAYYNDRLTALRRSSADGSAKVERVEKDLENIDTKVKTLIKVVEDTATDYYENVSLANAYNILVPANSDAKTSIRNGLSNVLFPLIGLELLLLMGYIGTAFSQAVYEDYRKRQTAREAASGAAAAAQPEQEPATEAEPEDKKKK
jgi:hypothetical protein